MESPAASICAAGPGHDRRIALTFDDGPAASTEAVLDVLSAEDARATFFIVGGFVAGRESTLQRASAEGHELGVHGWNHFNAMHMREPEKLLHELNACADELERALGERPQLVRPPYGGDAGRTARAAAKLGLGPVVLWTVVCFDWEDGAQADAIAGARPRRGASRRDHLPARRRWKGRGRHAETPRSQRCPRSCRAFAGTATSS